MPKKVLFTSESVTEGHPDKIADQISDAILDSILEQDPNGRVACETIVTTGQVHVFGEITTDAKVDIPRVIRKTIGDIGYTDASYGFDSETCAILISLDEQSPDIAMGVDRSLESKEAKADSYDIGAGDQGMMFGYACNETPEFLPLPIAFAHRLSRRLAEVRKNGQLAYLRPDGKTQVTVEYIDGKPVRIDTIVISTQHAPDITQKAIREDMIEHVIKAVLPAEFIDENTKYLINPTGRFVIGGRREMRDSLDGKLLLILTAEWLAMAAVPSPEKIRQKWIAQQHMLRVMWQKNIVAAGLADKCEIQLAYAIGVARPVSILVDTFGTGKIDEEQIVNLVEENFELRPAGIIDMLNLRHPIYRQTAAYGHFGRDDIDLPWEHTDKAESLKRQVGI